MTFPVNRHRVWQLVADGALVTAAWWLAFQLRFDHGVPPYYETLFSRTIVVVIAIKLVVFVAFGFYNRWWRYVSTRDMWSATRGVLTGSFVAYAIVYFAEPVNNVRLPRGIAATDLLLTLAFVAGTRLVARSVMEHPRPGSLVTRGREAIVVGAGDAGQLIIREMQRNTRLRYTPIGLVDDDPRKKNLRIHGVRVLGPLAELETMLREHRPDEVLIAIPSAPGAVRQGIVDVCRAQKVAVKTLPALHELISGDVDLARQLRPVQVEDVLGRQPVVVDLAAIASYLAGETVLVTGAGGSIGSELCRQIARIGAERLILVDQSESALFEIERELLEERDFSPAVPVLGDVKDRSKMREVFERYRPAVVFHAAAYKHVPLLEANPVESVRNNVFGTRTMAEVAVEFGTTRFVLVSTDKAANPKTVMGQSKAVCEWIVEAYGLRDDVATRFVAVRFGNVLNSSGSVIPIFRKQIERGGPLTVTHPEMTRYFMTIPEAVSLIVQAGAFGNGGQVYVLDMGEPVSILELAKNMIRLSGRDESEIAIKFVGPRAGEKLHEVLWSDGEQVLPTKHAKIRRSTRDPIDTVWLDDQLGELERLVEEGGTLDVVAKLNALLREQPRLDTGRRTPALEDTMH
ncbi:MAG TPA: nucleoside-diphosphate sugar epimerase/dehydratase [Gaiellaceae bacterium]|nr:nucleoside-diphosphate sugar epimerase/dehydratase [Gaiellaceae bacterium]